MHHLAANLQTSSQHLLSAWVVHLPTYRWTAGLWRMSTVWTWRSTCAASNPRAGAPTAATTRTPGFWKTMTPSTGSFTCAARPLRVGAPVVISTWSSTTGTLKCQTTWQTPIPQSPVPQDQKTRLSVRLSPMARSRRRAPREREKDPRSQPRRK